MSSGLFSQICDLCHFSSNMFVLCPFGYAIFKYTFYIASSLVGRGVPLFPLRMSLLEVRMSCRSMSSSEVS